MSRGFVKEEDQEEAPFIPPRAALPPGMENYVTPQGYQALLDEKEALLQARKDTQSLGDTERRRENTVIDGKITLLDERIQTARIIEPEKEATEVRFGCTVQFRPVNTQGAIRQFKIVGVDEASVKDLKVSFVAPIVQAMMGKKPGEEFEFALGGQTQVFRVEQVD